MRVKRPACRLAGRPAGDAHDSDGVARRLGRSEAGPGRGDPVATPSSRPGKGGSRVGGDVMSTLRK
jgi:hypothetical protein